MINPKQIEELEEAFNIWQGNEMGSQGEALIKIGLLIGRWKEQHNREIAPRVDTNEIIEEVCAKEKERLESLLSVRLESTSEPVDEDMEKVLQEAFIWGRIDDLRGILATAFTSQREEIINEVKNILTDEIATAHTSESGKTSRLTSAYNRVDALICKTEI